VSCILQFHDLNITPSAAGHGWGQAGHKVYTPTLTGLGERAHLMMNRTINLDTHVQDIVSVIRCEELSAVVLCGQSYGGMVIAGVAEQIAGPHDAVNRMRRCFCACAFQRPVVAGARLAAAVYQGRKSRAGRRACAGALLEQPLDRAAAAEAMTDDLPFKVVRSNGTELARAMNLLIARVVTLLRRAYERLPPAACGSN
jgi:pimeloyl-ACP methyl ester carboxylesterase